MDEIHLIVILIISYVILSAYHHRHVIQTIADSDPSAPRNAVMAGEGRLSTPLFIHKKAWMVRLHAP
jgi:hypothetical protein